jgi:hypothetical protein
MFAAMGLPMVPTPMNATFMNSLCNKVAFLFGVSAPAGRHWLAQRQAKQSVLNGFP